MDDNIEMKTQSIYGMSMYGKTSRPKATVQSLFVYCWKFCSSCNDVISETVYVPSNARMVFNDALESTGSPFYRVPEKSSFIA